MKALRALAALTLSLLLVGMQLGALAHALEHDGERLARPHGAALVVPGADDVCATCAAFAGGAHASPAADRSFVTERAPVARSASDLAVIAGTTPDYYRARAPPTLL